MKHKTFIEMSYNMTIKAQNHSLIFSSQTTYLKLTSDIMDTFTTGTPHSCHAARWTRDAPQSSCSW